MPSNDLFNAIGGTAKCRELSKAFYRRIDQDPVLRPFFPGASLTCAVEAFSAFLVQFLGGPQEDSQRRWFLSLQESHQRFKIKPKHRDTWMHHMRVAIDEVDIAEPGRSALRAMFEHASNYLIEAESPVTLAPETNRRWKAQVALDQAVDAIRKQDAPLAISLADTCERTVLPGLLALMIGSNHPDLLAYVHQHLEGDPTLVSAQWYNGRTLLHAAAAAGELPTVELLLRLGAEPDALDAGKHSPLQSLCNECQGARCALVVDALVAAGADVDARAGATHSTPLHMAARRGNAATAKALLDHGARTDLQDIRGSTPLQRAINCKKIAVAELLRSYR